MECATVYCDLDECCTILNKSKPKARKRHRCTECRRIIEPGETYLRETTVFDGKVETWKTCIDCKSIRDNLFSGGFFYGEIKYMLRDHVGVCHGDISETILATLTPGARAMVCEMIEEVWENAWDMESDE